MEKNPCTLFKYVYSTILLIFSVVIIMGLVFTEQTKLSEDVHPALAFFVLWLAIIWLTMVEGGQGALVGLAPVQRELYKDSHPITYKICSLAHKGDNLDRYLLGRQLMVVVIVFCVNMSGAPIKDAELWGFPQGLTDVFLGSGLAMILLTCMVGQLNSQVNGCHCMLDYINNHFATFTLWVAMAIEFSGLLHSSYLVQMLVAFLARQKIESFEEPRNAVQNLFFYGRCFMSLFILAFCFAVTMVALFDGKTTIWEGIPVGASIVIFFILLCVVGMLEGMQIAFFAAAKLRKCERGEGRFAKMTCDILYRGKARNLSGFMIGRQLCVVSCMFFVARITSVEIEDGEENIFGVSDAFQELFNTGLLGALIVTIVASIAWQLVASAFPIAFISNPLVYVFLRITLLLEATGLCSGAWVLAAIHKKIAGFKRDEVYIGTAEERAARKMGDDDSQVHVGTGHITKPAAFEEGLELEDYTLEEIEQLQKEVAEHKADVEARQRALEARRQRLISGVDAKDSDGDGTDDLQVEEVDAQV